MSGYLEAQLAILCLNIIYAYGVFLPAASGQLNLGAAGFITIGAYTSAYFNDSFTGMGLPMIASVPVAVAATGLVGFLISFPILRTRGVFMVLATFAFAEVVSGLALNLDFLGGAAGMPVEAHAPVGVLVPVTIGVIVFCIYLMSTRLGLSMRSIHDDESVSTLFGVSTRATKVTAFTIGAALTGLGGALYGHHFNYIEAQVFNVILSIYILLYVLMGGTQTPFGPLVGAVFFTAVPEIIRQLGRDLGSAVIEDSRFIIFGVLVVLMMVFRPEGIVTRTLVAKAVTPRSRRSDPAETEAV